MHEGELESSDFEVEEFGNSGQAEVDTGFNETEEMELAARLLEIADDRELDQFIGGLIQKAARTVGQVIKSPVLRPLGAILKSTAKQALPILDRAVGGYLVPGAGMAVGQRLAAAAGTLFGLELEGLSPEDREFEVARRWVRFAGASSRRAARMSPRMGLQFAASRAITAAARRYAPGFLRRRRRPGIYPIAPSYAVPVADWTEPVEPLEPLEPPEQQKILQELYESPELLNAGLLSFEYPLFVADDEELDYFLGRLIRSAGRTIGGVAKGIGKGISAIDKVVPVSMLVSANPLGMAFRAGLGAVQAAAEGRNVFQGAMRSMAASPTMRFLIDTGMATARGENILKAAQRAAKAGIGDVRKSLQFAAMVAPFIPGIGTGVAAALGAANALASGQPITEALIAAARSAVPGGAIAQVAFDTAMNLAKGKNVGEALLDSVRSKLPGGPAAQAAFDAAVTLAKGKSIQDAAFAAAGRILPRSPYAADALSFVRKVASGQNIQRAALSAAGNLILNKIERQTGPILSNARRWVPQAPSGLAASRAAGAAALALARQRALLRLSGRHRELSEIDLGAQGVQSGRWVRKDGYVIALGV
jgi:hypothetical protein